MVIQQRTYLNASITNVNMNLGWNSSPSQVQVGLVEDSANGDNFIQPSIGGPTFFDYYNLSLGGIITSSRRESNTGGDPTYSVTIEDPRSILEGVQLIIDGYAGGVYNMPNIYNIFGYWESFSFGNALVNSTGMPWQRIRDGLVALNSNFPIVFGSTQYYLDISSLPAVSEYFRIAGPNLSIMDFITQICEAASHEFFFNLEEVGSRYYIKLYVVNRSAQPQLNRISTWINSQEEVVSTSTGFQLRNEVSSKFLVGGNVHAMYHQYPSGESELTRDDDVVWPFWGVDTTNSVIIGGNNADSAGNAPVSGDIVKYFGNDHAFTIPSKGVNVVGVGDIYTTDVAEMRAALGGIDSWKTYLESQVNKPSSPHFKKSAAISIRSDVRFEILGLTPSGEMGSLTPVEFAHLTGGTITSATDSLDEIHDENISRLYEYVRSYADQYYGKKFMVRLPNIKSKFNPDWDGSPATAVLHNIEPADGGFIEDALWSGAVLNNYLPEKINTLLLDDNRISAYVRFNNFKLYDFSDLSPDDFTVNSANNSAFVKCELEPNVYFLNYNNLYSPRVVITLPGMVTLLDTKSFKGTSENIKAAKMEEAGLTPAEAKAKAKEMNSHFGSDLPTAAWAGQAVIPDMTVCPLKSNVDFYGPWYYQGVNGKTEFIKDESLVPWNYGGFALMNQTAASQISSSVTNFQVGEEGTLEVAGVPEFNIGDTLIAGGPYITDINVSVTNGGVTTTYTMNTWGVRNTGVQKQLLDEIKRNKINDLKLRREMREFDNRDTKKRTFAAIKAGRYPKKPIEPPRGRSVHSTNPVIASEMIEVSSGVFKSNTVIMPAYYAASQLGDNYEKKSLSTLDALFRPFSTDPDCTDLPHFEGYSGTDTINVDTLNPYQDGSDFVLVSKNFPGENEDMKDADGYSKGTSFRMPMVGTGWGYTTNGKPVPSKRDIDPSGSPDEYVDNYINRMDLWKSGPIELSWDENRKVWVGGGGSNIKLGKLDQNLIYNSSGLMTVWDYSSASGVEIAQEEQIYAHDWFLPTGGVIYSGRRIGVAKIGQRYYVIAAEPDC